MAPQISILPRTKTLIKTLTQIKPISTFPHLLQEPQLATPDDPSPTPLPPNPATGSPLYNENWRSPIPTTALPGSASLILPSFLGQSPASRFQSMSETPDVSSLLNLFAGWAASQRWADVKQVFEFWIRSLDKSGKPNKPNVDLYNLYLRANLMAGSPVGDLLDLVAGMEDFALSPNTASFNLVLKGMYEAKETDAAQKLLQRMEVMGEAQPDDESYDLVIGMLFETGQTNAAFKHVDHALKLKHNLSMRVFQECVRSCWKKGMLDALVSIIEKCKTMDQNKALSPSWNMCNIIAEVAIQEDNSRLAFYTLEFLSEWISKGELFRPPILLSVDEGMVVSALGMARRTYNSTLLNSSWEILRRSLRHLNPKPESYIAKISAQASLGHLQKAFGTLREFESVYESTDKEAKEELFSPFTSLHPLVVACCSRGFETLDSVYFQLENLSRAERPYKSVAALNCIILGCTNVWDLNRAYQTFEAIGSSFGLTPDIHSYNCLMYAFGKLKKTFEATRVFEHLVSLGIKPNAKSYSLLVDAHLINRDAKSALSVIDEMGTAGFVPSKETLRKVKRRCIREMDYDSNDSLGSLAKQLKIRLGAETRRDMLFNLEYSTDYA